MIYIVFLLIGAEICFALATGIAYWFDSDIFSDSFIHEWTIKRFYGRNWFGIIQVSLITIIILPALIIIEIMQCIRVGIEIIIDAGLK